MATIFPSLEYLRAKGFNLTPVSRSSDRMKPDDVVIGEKAAPKTNEARHD